MLTMRSYTAQVFDRHNGNWKELSRFEMHTEAASYARAMRLRWPNSFAEETYCFQSKSP